MGKIRKVAIPKVPVAYLIQENTNSIANSDFILIDLQKYNDLEEKENEAFEVLKNILENTKEYSKYEIIDRVRRALKMLNFVDMKQDEIIIKVQLRSIQIKKENRKSNGYLQIYDIKGPYQKWKIKEGIKKYKEEQSRLMKLPLKENAHTVGSV
ncbi:hypothetical protein SAMN02745164_00489 [Marinitoga hydrogenitolerans DSM 16785]|uniref:Uncharacterized protein n=1 Tax=Marinitoga hydrogenitolerans (strain DSM 16785 / JCM 12826 / AT1271) TaxID=1122195 RepID=A0A1M4TS49_MARH1|nr:hypothetical protein [Marinitoga hydrogenitolerans]SHE47215.1 hypothetical protein SAMN02745164_00489 [Marinitoga hydrogenitolerans DSM 16785]